MHNVSITYNSDLDLAKDIIYKLVTSHPEVVDIRTEEEILNKEPQITVFVRELSERGISLRTSVTTSSIDTNFKTCSEIREQLVKEFRKYTLCRLRSVLRSVLKEKGYTRGRKLCAFWVSIWPASYRFVHRIHVKRKYKKYKEIYPWM